MNAGERLIAHMRASAAQLAEACTACGACYRACPTVPGVAALAGAVPEAVMAGVRGILREGAGGGAGGDAGGDAAVAFAAACCRSGVCTEACPEKLDAALLMRLANLRVRGAMGETARVSGKHDAGWSSRVKAFARLTMSEEEQAKWL